MPAITAPHRESAATRWREIAAGNQSGIASDGGGRAVCNDPVPAAVGPNADRGGVESGIHRVSVDLSGGLGLGMEQVERATFGGDAKRFPI